MQSGTPEENFQMSRLGNFTWGKILNVKTSCKTAVKLSQSMKQTQEMITPQLQQAIVPLMLTHLEMNKCDSERNE